MSGPLSQREAARSWGVSRASMQRAIKAGKLSLTADKLIDPAEMVRVFGEPSRPNEPLGSTPEPVELLARIERLEAERTGLLGVIDAQKANLADLRAQVLMLTHERTEPAREPAPAPVNGGFWSAVKRLW